MADSSAKQKPRRPFIQVCQYRSCVRGGAEAVFDALQEQAATTEDFVLSRSECMGQCSAGPNVRVLSDGTWYCRVTPEDVKAIVEKHIQNGEPVDRLLHPRFHLHR